MSVSWHRLTIVSLRQDFELSRAAQGIADRVTLDGETIPLVEPLRANDFAAVGCGMSRSRQWMWQRIERTK